MKFVKTGILSSIILISIITTVYFGFNIIGILNSDIDSDIDKKISVNEEQNNKDVVFNLTYNPGGSKINNPNESELFIMYAYEEDLDSEGKFKYSWFEKKVEAKDAIEQIKNESNTVVVLPVFTHSAYVSNGFYDYYRGECDEKCLTVKIERTQPPQFNAGKNAIQILNLLNYSFISDIQIDQNPDILSQYDKVILLHSEYVTKKEFDAIASHPNVVYLYPNSLYAEIEYDSEKDEIKLKRGHRYPDSSIDNGFNWEFDNTRPYEFDTECVNWEFKEISNGVMLNCYPENLIWKDIKFLKTLKEL